MFVLIAGGGRTASHLANELLAQNVYNANHTVITNWNAPFAFVTAVFSIR